MKLRVLAGALLLGIGTAALAAEQVERSEVLTMGAKAGFQEARYADDGSVQVHYEFNDRGRGPKLDSEYRVGADGTVTSVAVKGNDYFKGPVDDTLKRDGNSITWKNASENETRTVEQPSFYLGLNGVPEEYVLLVRALLKAPEQKLAILPAGEARIEKLIELKVNGKPGKKKVTLYAVHGLDLTPSFFWLDDQQRFFASYSSWSSLVREGYAGALPTLAKTQEAREKQQAQQRATNLTETLKKPC